MVVFIIFFKYSQLSKLSNETSCCDSTYRFYANDFNNTYTTNNEIKTNTLKNQEKV